jgi:hypothetical protein
MHTKDAVNGVDECVETIKIKRAHPYPTWGSEHITGLSYVLL